MLILCAGSYIMRNEIITLRFKPKKRTPLLQAVQAFQMVGGYLLDPAATVFVFHEKTPVCATRRAM